MPVKRGNALGLQEAIEEIRTGLLGARASGENSDIRLPVQSATVELQVVAAAEAGGTAGFKVPVVNLEVGGSAAKQWSSTHTVTVVFGPPVDRLGNIVKIVEDTDEEKD
jgi:hypothetical protein